MALRDIIQLLGTISDLRRYQQAGELAAQHERTSAFGEFTSLLPHLRDSGSADELIRSYAQTTGIPETALRDVASRYQQPSSDLTSTVYQQFLERNRPGTPEGDRIRRETSYAVGTGANAGAAARSEAQTQAFGSMDDALRRAFNVATATGLGVGDYAMQSNLAGLPVEQLTAFNRIRGGTQTSQPQADELGLRGLMGGADINQRDRALSQEGILGLITAQARGGQGSNQLIEDARNRFHKNIEDITKVLMSPAGQLARIREMRQDYDLVNGQGAFMRDYPEIAQVFRDPKTSIQPGVLAKIFYKVF